MRVEAPCSFLSVKVPWVARHDDPITSHRAGQPHSGEQAKAQRLATGEPRIGKMRRIETDIYLGRGKIP